MININNTKSVFILALAIFLLPLCMRAKTEDINITIPFQLVNGLIILQAEIDGVSGSYILDTGANTILVDGQADNPDQILSTPEGEVMMSHRELTKFSIGAFTQYEISAQVISLSSLQEQLGIEIDGIIGGGYFMPNVLSLDFSTSTINISSKSIEEAAIDNLNPYTFKMVNDIPIVEVEIEHSLYHFAMDSGASIHFIDLEVCEVMASAKKIKTTSQVLTVDRVKTSHEQYVVNKFRLGSTSFIGHHFISQSFEQVNTELDIPISGILSLSKLSRNKVILDFKNSTLYF